MSAPNGTGREVFKERAVNSKISPMCASSIAVIRDLAEAEKAMTQFITMRGWLASRLYSFFAWERLDCFPRMAA
jgi:hypothetical protein